MQGARHATPQMATAVVCCCLLNLQALDGPAFVVEDGNYVSARWPGDAYKFARALLSRL